MNKFIKYSFPNSVQSLSLWNAIDKRPMSNHFESLIKAIPSITSEIFFHQFITSKEEFEGILNSSECSKLAFNFCKIDTSSSLTLTNSSITHLSFQCCGSDGYSDWGNNEDKFENIIEAIAKSPMKDNIQKLNVFSCGLSLERMKEIAKSHGIDELKVVDEGQWQPM